MDTLTSMMKPNESSAAIIPNISADPSNDPAGELGTQPSATKQKNESFLSGLSGLINNTSLVGKNSKLGISANVPDAMDSDGASNLLSLLSFLQK
jgi:hypothetical protein